MRIWILVCVSALISLALAMWLIHADQRNIEMFARHALVAPVLALGLALFSLAAPWVPTSGRASGLAVLARAIRLALSLLAMLVIAVVGMSLAISVRAARMIPASVTLSGDSHVFVSGAIDRHLPFRVRRAIDELDGCEIWIDSYGGDVIAAEMIADFVARQGCTVRALHHCASACIQIWVASPSRVASGRTLFGLHRSTLGLGSSGAFGSRIVAERRLRDTRKLVFAGFPRSLVEDAMMKPPYEVVWRTATELREAGVKVRVIE